MGFNVQDKLFITVVNRLITGDINTISSLEVVVSVGSLDDYLVKRVIIIDKSREKAVQESIA